MAVILWASEQVWILVMLGRWVRYERQLVLAADASTTRNKPRACYGCFSPLSRILGFHVPYETSALTFWRLVCDGRLEDAHAVRFGVAATSACRTQLCSVAQWLGGSVARWLGGSVARWLDHLGYSRCQRHCRGTNLSSDGSQGGGARSVKLALRLWEGGLPRCLSVASPTFHVKQVVMSSV